MLKGLCKPVVMSGALLLTAAAHAAPTNLIANGGFETGDFSSWSQAIAGTQSISAVNPKTGSYAAELNNTSPSANIISQTGLGAGFLTAGQSVTVSFDFRGTASAGGVFFPELFSLDANNAVTKTEIVGGGPLFPNGNASTWTNFSVTTTIGPDVAGGLTLSLNAPCGADGGCVANYFIDNVAVVADIAVVPVPAAAWLLGSALAGLTVLKRKQS